MDWALTARQRDFRAGLRSFFESVAPPAVVAELDRTESFPHEIYAGMAKNGLTRLGLPEDYGGAAADEITMGLAIEEVAARVLRWSMPGCPP